MTVNKKLDELEFGVTMNEFNAYRRAAKNQDNKINKDVKEQVEKVFDEAIDQVKTEKETSFIIGKKKYEIKQGDDGPEFFVTDKNGSTQEMTQTNFKEDMRVSTKIKFMEDKDITGACLALDQNFALIAKPADIETNQQNRFEDGDKRFNYYLRDIKSGEEVQITKDQVQTKIKQAGIAAKDVPGRVGKNINQAADLLKKELERSARSAYDKGKEGLRRSLDLGEEMARM